MYIFVATEGITNPIGGRVESPKVDYKPGGAITFGRKAARGTQGRRFVPSSLRSVGLYPTNCAMIQMGREKKQQI